MTIPELYELFIHNPKVTTDSRNCPRGSIFFALKGAGIRLRVCGNRQSGLFYRRTHNPCGQRADDLAAISAPPP